MIRLILGLLGAVAAVLPDRTIDVFEAVAIENPGDAPTRPWVESVIRLEGLLVTLASFRGDKVYDWMMHLTGGFGAVVLLSPDLYRRFAIAFLYEEPDSVVWNRQFSVGIRIIGAIYVLLALLSYNPD